MKKILLGSLLLVFAVLGCDDDSMTYDENVKVEPVTVTGSVSGVVYSAQDGNPLADVQVVVTVSGSSLSTSTDENGFFSVKDVPAYGSVQVTYMKDGFYTAYSDGAFPELGGDVPHQGMSVTVRPVWMVAKGTSLTIRLVDPNGNPIPGVEVRGSINSGSYIVQDDTGEMLATGSVTARGTTDDTGRAVLTDLPQYPQMLDSSYYNLKLQVPQVDLDGDGMPEYEGTTTNIDLRRYHYREITLSWASGISTTLYVTKSSFYYLTHNASNCAIPGTREPGEQVFILYSRAIDAISIEIYDEDGTLRWSSGDSQNPLSYTLTDGNRRVLVDLPTDLEPGSMYWISLMAVSSGAQKHVISAPFFTAPPEDTPLAIVSITPDDPSSTSNFIVEFNYPIGTGCSWISSIPGNSKGIVFLDMDLDGSGQVGDANGEIGASISGIVFQSMSELPDLPQSTGFVGFSRKWYFADPLQSNTVPLNTPVYLKFYNVTDSRYIMTTPWGEATSVLSAQIQPATN